MQAVANVNKTTWRQKKPCGWGPKPNKREIGAHERFSLADGPLDFQEQYE